MADYILGIESSCDETGAAVYHPKQGMCSNALFSQIELHTQFGGVIPEIASRAHLGKINHIVQEALDQAGITLDDVGAIAVTNKPGLPGSLLVGVCFAKSLAYAKNIPIIGVNHLEGHVFSACIENQVPFPHLCLTASGGHTSLYLVRGYGDYQEIGHTRDDAAGEAFDKVAKLLDLGYPGGPLIERLAREMNFEDFFHFPRSMHDSLEFSFSGLKTAVLYRLVDEGAYDMARKQLIRPDDLELKKKVASSLLVAISDMFIDKITLASRTYPEVKAVTFVGGVACNKFIKQSLERLCAKKKLAFFTPSPAYCTDNGGMIAFVGSYKAAQGKYDSLELDILK